jgi:DNA-binding PadR family transcriptional regulator
VTNQKADLLQGTLDMLILKALSLGTLHGYGVIQRIRQMSEEMLTVEQGLSTRRFTASSRRVGSAQSGT